MVINGNIVSYPYYNVNSYNNGFNVIISARLVYYS